MEEKVATSEQKVATFEASLKSIQGKNLKREELEEYVLRICKDHYTKKEELAGLLGKSKNYIRNKILPDLLKE